MTKSSPPFPRSSPILLLQLFIFLHHLLLHLPLSHLRQLFHSSSSSSWWCSIYLLTTKLQVLDIFWQHIFFKSNNEKRNFIFTKGFQKNESSDMTQTMTRPAWESSQAGGFKQKEKNAYTLDSEDTLQVHWILHGDLHQGPWRRGVASALHSTMRRFFVGC